MSAAHYIGYNSTTGAITRVGTVASALRDMIAARANETLVDATTEEHFQVMRSPSGYSFDVGGGGGFGGSGGEVV